MTLVITSLPRSLATDKVRFVGDPVAFPDRQHIARSAGQRRIGTAPALHLELRDLLRLGVLAPSRRTVDE